MARLPCVPRFPLGIRSSAISTVPVAAPRAPWFRAPTALRVGAPHAPFPLGSTSPSHSKTSFTFSESRETLPVTRAPPRSAHSKRTCLAQPGLVLTGLQASSFKHDAHSDLRTTSSSTTSSADYHPISSSCFSPSWLLQMTYLTHRETEPSMGGLESPAVKRVSLAQLRYGS